MTDQSPKNPTCPNCGLELAAVGGSFCPRCGSALASVSSTLAQSPGFGQPPMSPPEWGQGQPQGQPNWPPANAPAWGQQPGTPPPWPPTAQTGWGQPPAAKTRSRKLPALIVGGALLLVVVLAAGGFVLVSSGGSKASPSPSVLSAVPTDVPTEMPTEMPTPAATPTAAGTAAPQYAGMSVGFVQTNSQGGWRGANTQSFLDASIASGVKLQTRYASDNFSAEVGVIQDFIADSTIDVIVIAPVQSSGWDAVLKAAKAAGKTVIIEDMAIDSSPSLYYTYVAPDFVAEGEKVATAMCTLLKDATGKSVLEIAGTDGSPAAVGRAKGFRQNMGPCGMTIKATKKADWDPDQAQSVTSAYLSADKNVQAIFAHNDMMALGAIRAIKLAGLTPGKDIQVVGVDGTSDGFHAMIEGDLGADVDCSPDLGPQVYKAAWDAMHGKASPSFIAGQDAVFYASQGADALRQILAGRHF